MKKEIEPRFVRGVPLEEVESSNIAKLGFKEGVVEVRFRNGGAYQHSGVGADVYRAVRDDATSIGAAYAKLMRGQFETRRVAPNEEDEES